jgi:hypothetical protein
MASTYIYFDTENTGLETPISYNPDYTAVLLQLAGQIRDCKTHALISKFSYIVKPRRVVAQPYDPTRYAFSMQHGVKPEEALVPFILKLKKADVLVAHNVAYDVAIILAAAQACGLYEEMSVALSGLILACTSKAAAYVAFDRGLTNYEKKDKHGKHPKIIHNNGTMNLRAAFAAFSGHPLTAADRRKFHEAAFDSECGVFVFQNCFPGPIKWDQPTTGPTAENYTKAWTYDDTISRLKYFTNAILGGSKDRRRVLTMRPIETDDEEDEDLKVEPAAAATAAAAAPAATHPPSSPLCPPPPVPVSYIDDDLKAAVSAATIHPDKMRPLLLPSGLTQVEMVNAAVVRETHHAFDMLLDLLAKQGARIRKVSKLKPTETTILLEKIENATAAVQAAMIEFVSE